MALNKIMLSVFALAAVFASCSSDKTDPKPAGPATVEKLTSPKDGVSVNMYFVEALQFEWKSAGNNVKYELVIDKADGDFSAPVAIVESEKNSLLFPKAEIEKLFKENADEKGEVAELKWGVYAIDQNNNRTFSKETRLITFTTLSSPAVVETLIAPKDDALLILDRLTDDVTFSWSKAIWLGEEDEVSYTFVLDEADKDFSEPLISMETATTEVVVTREKLLELYAASAVAAEEENYSLKWAVYANAGANSTVSEEIGAFSIRPKAKVKPFEVGDPLYVRVAGSSEDGQLMSYITSTYYRTDNKSWRDRMEGIGAKWEFPYYEIFVSLKAGEKYCFYTTDEGEKTHFYKVTASDAFVEGDDEAAATAEAAQTAIYRIRINAGATPRVDMRKVEYINLRFGWGDYSKNNFTDAAMTYAGKGRWTIPSYHIVLKDMGSFKEDRYRFVMMLEGLDAPQSLSKNNEGLVTGGRPGREEDSSYWQLQLSYSGWDFWVFKYPAWLADDSNLGRWCADVNLYMNTEKGHYTHEFVNPVEVKSFEDGDPLYIDGSGTEAGQKFSYITEKSYNTTLGNSGEIDAFKDQDYKYEIFTKLSAGSKFYFRSVGGTDLYTLNAAGTEVRKIAAAAEAEGTVAAEGIYRIRFNITSGKAYVAPVGEVSHFFCWTSKLTPMTYEGKGVWVIKNLNISLQKTDWGFDERYKFKFMVDGKAQPFGCMSTNGNRPGASEPATYWYVQPSKAHQWEPAFKYPDALCDRNNLTRWYADLYLYMNDDKGHYTHEFTNAHE